MKYRIIIFILVGVLVVVSVLAFVFGRKPVIGQSAKLEFWGLDSANVWSEIILAYQTKNPSVVVNYVQKNPTTYESDLVNALASGAGPDVAYIRNTWLAKHLNKFSSAPADLISATDFKNNFMEVANRDLIRSGKIYALPFYVDTLALYYNKTLFNSAGLVNPPKTWEDFNSAVKELIQKSDDGTIGRAGASLGTAGNVKYAPDILSLLMLQTGAVMISADGKTAVFDQTISSDNKTYSPGQSALDFYTSFANSTKPVYTWNIRMPNSLDAFLQGQSAMYIGYAADVPAIQKKGLNYGVAPIPQVKDSKKDASYIDINFASYSAGAVTQKSVSKNAAWDFLVFTTGSNAAGTYLQKSLLPPARRDLIQFIQNHEALSVFGKQALSALSWPQPNENEVSKIFARMIDSVALGQSNSKEALKEAVIEVTNLLK